jgi:hypothetical protein
MTSATSGSHRGLYGKDRSVKDVDADPELPDAAGIGWHCSSTPQTWVTGRIITMGHLVLN